MSDPSIENPSCPLSADRVSINNAHHFGFGALDPAQLHKGHQDSAVTFRAPSNKFQQKLMLK